MYNYFEDKSCVEDCKSGNRPNGEYCMPGTIENCVVMDVKEYKCNKCKGGFVVFNGECYVSCPFNSVLN
jgi:hypothetical protein